MRIWRPLQRTDLRWEMTQGTGSTGPYPTGYCAGWREPDSVNTPAVKDYVKRDLEKRLPFKDKFHTDGHETREEALACWDEYRLDLKLKVVEEPDTQRRCKLCSVWTISRVKFAGVALSKPVALCPDHQDRESVKRVIRSM